MVCIGICYARKKEARTLAKRGVALLLIGLLRNVFRYVIPFFIGYAVTGEKLPLNAFPFLFGVDILEFAGLAFLFFALARKYMWSNKVLAAIAIIASFLGMILRWMSVWALVDMSSIINTVYCIQWH